MSDDNYRKPEEDSYRSTYCNTGHQDAGVWALQTHQAGWKYLSSDHVLAALLPNQGYVCTQQATINVTNLSINCPQIKPPNFN